MRILKCDRCKREIKDREAKLHVSGEHLSLFGLVFHPRCAAPIVSFLRRLKLLTEDP